MGHKHENEEEPQADSGKKKKDERGEMERLDPEKDTTDPTPFKEKPSTLALLIDPKSLESLEKIGGTAGLLQGLGVDPKKGLLQGADEAEAVQDGEARSGTQQGGGNGPQWTASMDERRKVYGPNELPERKSKSFWLLMWIAFKDKVLVSDVSRTRI